MKGIQKYAEARVRVDQQDGWGSSVCSYQTKLIPSNYGEWVKADEALEIIREQQEIIREQQEIINSLRAKSDP
jgi:hypothetical protein